ncbi:DedA family protein [Micromonospora sp. NPDC049679]|uniref:DedA family protein n=1 Tax=Micromonospora sp. NPDC049679 TaxID=3155920 RepID=UPI003404CEF3
MRDLLDRLLNLPGTLVYVLVTLVVFVEDALFVGFVLPGETAAIVGGVAASLGHVSLPVMIALVVAAAIIGDTVGYEVGKRFGPRVLRSRPLRRHQHRLDRAREFLARRGGGAVFLGRFTAFFRAVMPALAGAAGMRYRRFLVYNVAGGLVWGAACVLAGYLAGRSYRTVEPYLGRGTAIVVVTIAVVALVLWRIRARRQRRDEE